jgi:uncharacterized protein YegL
VADDPSDDDLPLLDVESVPLSELLISGDTVLAHAIRRCLKEIETQVEAISGWSSYVDGTGPDG